MISATTNASGMNDESVAVSALARFAIAVAARMLIVYQGLP